THEAGAGGAMAPKKGRPPVGARAMSNTERSRLRRARAKAKPKPPKDANEVFEALCESRNLTSAFDRRLAEPITDSLCSGTRAEAVRGMALLPPVVRAEPGSPTVSTSNARRRVLEMVLNAQAADVIERRDRIARGVGTEIDDLRERLAQLEAPPALEPPEGEEGDADAPQDQDERLAALEAENRELRARLGEAPPPTDDQPRGPQAP